MSESAAAASIFRLSFVPVHGQTLDRRRTTILAEKIGPLCADCIEAVKDLAAASDEVPGDRNIPPPDEAPELQ